MKNDGSNQQIGHIIIFLHFSFNNANVPFQNFKL
jgi:hypothetical protein